MPINNFGNLLQGEYVGVKHDPPGWNRIVWVGMAIIDGEPKNEWEIHDNKDLPLVLATGTPLLHIGFRLDGDCTGTNGDRVKVGASATDTADYVISTTAIASSTLPAQDQQTLLDPFEFVETAGEITLGLYLHTSNVASSNTLVVAETSPVPLVIPAPVVTKPVKAIVEVHYLLRSGGVSLDAELYESDTQSKRLLGIP